MKYFLIFLILIGFVGSAFALDAETLHPTRISLEEHYKIEILGLKDEYTIGEEYSFYFVISGYGYSCANHQASYPDEDGTIMHVGAEVLCAPEKSMHEFKINSLEQQGTSGNTGIKKSGTYTVTVTFEKPSKHHPTTISKEFRVVESSPNIINLSPLKQLKSGTNYNDIKCSDGKVLVLKHGRTFPACVNPDTVLKLYQRNWALHEVEAMDIETEPQESKLIKVSGVVNRFDTFEGIEYQFIPLRKELPRIAHSGYNTVNLFATDDTIHKFIRNIDGSLVKIQGSFLFEDGKYWRYLSGFPIIPVEKLEVISENELLDYSIDGAELISITKIPDDNALNIVLEDAQGGTLEISIPRELIDAKMGDKVDDDFFVLIDGFEVPYTEIVDENTRTLTILFDEEDRIIEIIGTNWI